MDSLEVSLESSPELPIAEVSEKPYCSGESALSVAIVAENLPLEAH